MAAISYRQRDWFHGTIKENKGNTDSIVVRLGMYFHAKRGISRRE